MVYLGKIIKMNDLYIRIVLIFTVSSVWLWLEAVFPTYLHTGWICTPRCDF